MVLKPNKVFGFIQMSKNGAKSSNTTIIKYETKLSCQWPDPRSQISQFILFN